jgi:hypothetical protein
VIWTNKKALHLVGCKIGVKSTTLKRQLDSTGYARGWDRDDGYDETLNEGLWLIEGHK